MWEVLGIKKGDQSLRYSNENNLEKGNRKKKKSIRRKDPKSEKNTIFINIGIL